MVTNMTFADMQGLLRNYRNVANQVTEYMLEGKERPLAVSIIIPSRMRNWKSPPNVNKLNNRQFDHGLSLSFYM